MNIKTCDEDVPGGHSDNFDGFDRDNNPDFEPDWEAEYTASLQTTTISRRALACLMR